MGPCQGDMKELTTIVIFCLCHIPWKIVRRDKCLYKIGNNMATMGQSTTRVLNWIIEMACVLFSYEICLKPTKLSTTLVSTKYINWNNNADLSTMSCGMVCMLVEEDLCHSLYFLSLLCVNRIISKGWVMAGFN